MGEIKVELGERSYSVYVQKGILKHIAEDILSTFQPTSVCIVTDTNLSKIYLSSVQEDFTRLNVPVCSFVIEAGEASKNFSILETLCTFLIEQKMDRNGMLVALGGGVVGDLTGFAASIYKRGIAYVQVPTSVVAQTDSAIGGKTGVDFGGSKNMLGTIYQPKAVYVDPCVLQTLPAKYLSDGLGEVVKYAILAGGELFERVLSLQSPEALLLDDGFIVENCIAYKKHLVEKDERDTGDRMLLNLGHTVGHALESYYGYCRYSHGEGVAVGLIAIMKYAATFYHLDEEVQRSVTRLLQRLNLPVALPESNERVFSSIVQDKKCTGSYVRVVIPFSPGDVRVISVPTNEFIDFLCKALNEKGVL
ncbi:MAG: 3-dehydroquinate synthase [Clostridia bacterium]|nr:3-dehydroquinate synthase [Clostridia bacterium]